MIKKICKKILFYLVRKKNYRVLAVIYRFLILEKFPNGINKLMYSSGNGRITVLALDSDRYRGDLEVLASDPLLRILCIRSKWQGALISLFYNKDNISSLEYSTALPGDDIYDKIRIPTQEFMCNFLEVLFSKIKIDCVINVNYRYIEDVDWTLASEKIGIPYIMLYRECLMPKGGRLYNDVVHRHKLFKFHGSHIIVHNDTCKSSFIDSSFCDESSISVVGALRMDKYLKAINGRKYNSKNKKFVLFYFPYDMSLFGKKGKPVSDYKYKYAFSIWPKREEFFREIHTAIYELAIEYPDIDFIIKPKSKMTRLASWKFYEKVLDKINFDVNKIDNYFIKPNADVHELMLSSDVICAFQSSTAVEALITGKPVILPIFKSYRSTENYQDFHWKDDIELFNIVDNKSHFKDQIISLMDAPPASQNTLNMRKKLFKSVFNDTNGESLKKYISIISKIVNTKKKNMNFLCII
jgi:hypothetical protein